MNILLKLTIPLAAPSLNNWYSGNHWAKRKKLADLWHMEIFLACRKVRRFNHFPVKILTRSFYRKKRAFDCSNVFTANKLAEDGLVRAGVLPDDGPKYVCGHEVLPPVFGHEKDETVIILTLPEVG